MTDSDGRIDGAADRRVAGPPDRSVTGPAGRPVGGSGGLDGPGDSVAARRSGHRGDEPSAPSAEQRARLLDGMRSLSTPVGGESGPTMDGRGGRPPVPPSGGPGDPPSRETGAHRAVSHRAGKRSAATPATAIRSRWSRTTMIVLAGLLILTATSVGAFVIITATPDRPDRVVPAQVLGPTDPTTNADGCKSFDQALRRLNEIIASDVIPHPEIRDVLITARGRVAAASELTWGPTQQAMDRVVTRLQLWSDIEIDHIDGLAISDTPSIEGLRTAVGAVVTQCGEAGVQMTNRLTD